MLPEREPRSMLPGRGLLPRATAEPEPRGERVTLGRSFGLLLRATLPLWLRLLCGAWLRLTRGAA